MAVDAVEGGVEFGAGKPSVLMPLLVGIQDFVPALEPMYQLRGASPPEVAGVFQCAAAQGVVLFLATDPG